MTILYPLFSSFLCALPDEICEVLLTHSLTFKLFENTFTLAYLRKPTIFKLKKKKTLEVGR